MVYLLISTLRDLKQRRDIQSLCTSLLRRRDIQSLSLFSDFSVAHSYSYIGILASYLASYCVNRLWDVASYPAKYVAYLQTSANNYQ